MRVELKGLSFPRIFKDKHSNVVSGVEKARSDVRMLLHTKINSMLFNPNYGLDVESILFAEDTKVTRDFIYTFINDALVKYCQDVELESVTCSRKGEAVVVFAMFKYKPESAEFSENYSIGASMYE